MYLLNANLKYYPVKDSDKESDIIKKFRQALETNQIHIRYTINLSAHTIRYFFSDPTFGACSFRVNSSGGISDVIDSVLYPSFQLVNVFIQYLYEKETKASDTTLQALYPDIYEEEVLKKGMTEEEKDNYDDTKLNFRDFLSSLQTEEQEDEEVITEPEKLLFKVSINNHYTSFSFSVKAYNPKTKKKYSLSDSYERFILSGSPVEEKSKQILFAMAPLYYKPTYYYDDKEIKFVKQVLGQAIKAMATQDIEEKSFLPLEFEDEGFALENEVKTIQVSIDKDGNIISPYTENNHNFLFDFGNPKDLVYFDSKKHLATCLTFSTDAEKKLLVFKFNNPMFDTKYFGKEIAQSLVPAVKGVINIEPSFLSKSMREVDHIAYFIDLDKDKLELICKSKYFLRGLEVDHDKYKEKHAKNVDSFEKVLLDMNLPVDGVVSDEKIIADFISASLKRLKRTCQIFISEDVKKLKKKPIAKINIIVQSQQDWFSLHFQSNDYTDEEISSILSAYKKKKKYFRLRNDILTLDEGNGKDILTLMNDFDLNQTKIPVYQALKLKARQNVTLSDDIKELFRKVQNYDDQEVALDEHILDVIRPYQLKGVKWLTSLKENHLSGILADDMGLGKTLEVIAFLSQYHLNKPNLVVCPKSLTFNWEDEFHKWDPKSKVVVLSSGREDRHNKMLQMNPEENTTYIISYDSLRIDLDLFKNREFGFLILDEGQYIANALSQKTRAVKTLNADYKFALTGTPIQNSLMDLWSIFDFLMPGYLKTFTEFKKIYGSFDLVKEDRKHLENIVSPFLLKRKKDDVLTELPGKIVMTQNLVMDDEESKLYEAYLTNARKALQAKKEKGKNAGIEVLSALTRLRELCVDPSTFLDYKNISTKLDYTVALVKEAIGKGHKIIVFSSFTSVLDHLALLLDAEHITHKSIQGNTTANKRLELAKDFNENDDIKVMLVSLKAGGTGLNLIGGDIVIHLDPWWNVAAEDQASDRAYRIGQTRKVIIYKLVMKNTIEEKVLNLQEKKKDLSDIFDNINSKTALTDDDIEYLLN